MRGFVFECLLHISYRLGIKKWQVRSDEYKFSVQQRSEKIKQKFKLMELIVDKTKPGFGNTNDGNSARSFFIKPELSDEITGTLSLGYDIDFFEFKKIYIHSTICLLLCIRYNGSY